MSADLTPPSGPPDIDKISAMAHPVRRRIHDLLAVDGPATVGTLAERTGERPGSISHHLKMLAKAGLVEEAPDLARDRRESWWRPVSVTWSWSITDFAEDPAGELVAQAAEQEQLRDSFEKARAWYADRHDYDVAWHDAAYSSFSWLKVTPDQLADLSRRLTEVVRAFEAEIRPDPNVADTGDDARESVYLFTYAVPHRP